MLFTIKYFMEWENLLLYYLFTVNLPEPGIYSVVDDYKALTPHSRQLRAQVKNYRKFLSKFFKIASIFWFRLGNSNSY